MDSITEIIELYKRDVDRTLLMESLRRTPSERVSAAQDFGQFVEEMRAAMKKAKQRQA
jgi:hypothetical protein